MNRVCVRVIVVCFWQMVRVGKNKIKTIFVSFASLLVTLLLFSPGEGRRRVGTVFCRYDMINDVINWWIGVD